VRKKSRPGVRERETDEFKEGGKERHTYRQRKTYIHTEKEKQRYIQAVRRME
jgi:hypothetical protein